MNKGQQQDRAGRGRTILCAISDIERGTGYPPTYREIAALTGISLARVHGLIGRLNEEGLVELREGRSRGIRVTESGSRYVYSEDSPVGPS